MQDSIKETVKQALYPNGKKRHQYRIPVRANKTGELSDVEEYCDEYRLLCYEELWKRYIPSDTSFMKKDVSTEIFKSQILPI